MFLLRNLCIIALVAVLLPLAAESLETKVQGVLIDRMCSYKAYTRVVPGPKLEGGILVAYAHPRQCALMPDCQKSGYGVFTYDHKFLPFDEDGNKKALAFFKESNKDDDFRVEVTGEMQGETLKVKSIRPLP
jgi:hypothetical protein